MLAGIYQTWRGENAKCQLQLETLATRIKSSLKQQCFLSLLFLDIIPADTIPLLTSDYNNVTNHGDSSTVIICFANYSPLKPKVSLYYLKPFFFFLFFTSYLFKQTFIQNSLKILLWFSYYESNGSSLKINITVVQHTR